MSSRHENTRLTTVKRGSVTAKIYTVTRKRGPHKGEQFFQVADYSAGGRKFVSSGDLQDAKTHAERVAAQLSRGDSYAAGFGAQDRALFGRVMEMVKPLGIPLEVVVSDYVDTLRILGGDRQRLIEAARFFVQRNPTVLPQSSSRKPPLSWSLSSVRGKSAPVTWPTSNPA